MKNLLIASTALVASAGFASADIALTGGAQMGVIYESNNGVAGGASTYMQTEVDFNVVGSGTTDGGLTFGASLDLESDKNSSTNPATVANNTNDGEVFVSMNSFTLTLGNVDPATDPFGSADVGYDGLGVDDNAEGLRHGAGLMTDAHLAYVVGDLSLALGIESSTAASAGDYSIRAAYNFGDFTAAIGVANDNAIGAATDSMSTMVNLGGTFGAVAVNGFYVQKDFAAAGVATQTGFGLDASYVMGASTITVGYSDTDVAGDEGSYGIGVAYGLGGGATLQAGIASVDTALIARETKASMGIALTF